MKRKLVFLPILVFVLSSCSFSFFAQKPQFTFQSDFSNILDTNFKFTPNQLLESIPFKDLITRKFDLLAKVPESGIDDSRLHIAYNIPDSVSSGDVTLIANAIREVLSYSEYKIMTNFILTGSIVRGLEEIKFNKVDSAIGLDVGKTKKVLYGKIDSIDIDGIDEVQKNKTVQTMKQNIGKWYMLDLMRYSRKNSSSIDLKVGIQGIMNDILQNGTVTIIDALKESQILTSSGVPVISDNTRTYQVILSETGVLSVIDTLGVKYFGKPLSDKFHELVKQELFGDGDIGSGTLIIDTINPAISSFYYKVPFASESTTILFQKSGESVKISGMKEFSQISNKEGFVYENKTYGTGNTFLLDVYSGTGITHAIRGKYSSGSATKAIDLELQTSKKSTSIIYLESNLQGSFSGYIETRNTYPNYSTFSGDKSKIQERISKMRLSCDGSFSVNLKKYITCSTKKDGVDLIKFIAHLDNDRNFDANFLQGKQSILTLTGFFHSGNILVDAMIFTKAYTFEYKKDEKGDFSSKFSFPSGSVRTTGRYNDGYLDSFYMLLQAPQIYGLVNLKPTENTGSVSGLAFLLVKGKNIMNGYVNINLAPTIFNIGYIGTIPGYKSISKFLFESVSNIQFNSSTKVTFPDNAVNIYENLTGSSVSATESYLMRSRDAARMSNLKDISTSLGAYYADTESYPSMKEEGCVSPNFLSTIYMSRGVPVDPDRNHRNDGCDVPGQYAYKIWKDSSGRTQYTLSATLENEVGGNSRIPLSQFSTYEELKSSLLKGLGKYYILTTY